MALTIISTISILLTFFYVAIVLLFKKGWISIRPFEPSDTVPLTKVSVLIAARNEERNIGLTLDDITEQRFPAHLLEVIVVDDHSTDATSEIVMSYSHKGVKLIRLNEDKPLNSYKKKAISEAINCATGELIITTDADCRMSADWLRTVVLYYEQNHFKLISSPVAYFGERSLFEELQTLEFLYLIGLGASSIGNKMPSTCNGANLAYRKDVFLELNGFKGIDDLASGDDELFLHKVAARYPDRIGFCKSDRAIVYTHPKDSLESFIQQRKRWASKSTKYKNKFIVALGVSIWLFNLMMLLNIGLAIFYLNFTWLAAFCLLLKGTAEAVFLMPLTRFINRKKLIFYLPLLTALHVFYIVFIGIAGNSGKYNWKGRQVR